MSEPGDCWFFVRDKNSEDETRVYMGHCSWSERDEYEIWTHINGVDYGYVAGESSDDIPHTDMKHMVNACLSCSRIGEDIQVTIHKNNDKVWILGYKDVNIPLEMERHKLDLEDLYEASMRLVSSTNEIWENRLKKVTEEALQVIERSRNGIIDALNQRNRKIRELEQELKRTRSQVSVPLGSPPQFEYKSPVKRELSDLDEDDKEPEEPLVPAQSYPFMGINRSRTSLSSSPEKRTQTVESSPIPITATSDAVPDEGNTSEEDTDLTDTGM